MQREKLIEILSQYFTIGDSDEYSLLRDKSAFAIGTIHEEKVEFVGVTTENVFGGLCPLPSEKWGKEYFLNKAEAEAALEKLLEKYDGKN